VRYRIVATEANNVRTDLAEPFEMVMLRNTAGYDLWFGLVTRGGVPPGRYLPDPPPAIVVEVAAQRYQRVEAVIGSLPRPDAPQQFNLQPSWDYEFPTTTSIPGGTGPTLLRGTLHGPDGLGIAGARVRVDPLPPNQPPPGPEYVVDHTGNWVLHFDDAVVTTATARVEITASDGSTTAVTEVTINRSDTSALRQASLAGLTRRSNGATLPGVVITVDAVPGISTTSDADGRWELWLPVQLFPPSAGPQPVVVTAAPPQGAPLAHNGDIQPRATARVEPFVFP
jgi:hypothetical protein